MGSKGEQNPWFFVLATNWGEMAKDSDLRFFAFEAKDAVLKDDHWYGWVTGTLKGTWKPKLAVEYPAYPRDAVLPLLTDVELEVHKRP